MPDQTPDRVCEQLSGASTPACIFYTTAIAGQARTAFVCMSIPSNAIERTFRKFPTPLSVSPVLSTGRYLIAVGQRLVNAVRPRFPQLLLRQAAPIHFYLVDLDAAIRFDLHQGTVEAGAAAVKHCDLALHSQALWFAFKFPWGFGTLEVSGRYTRMIPRSICLPCTFVTFPHRISISKA